MKYEKLTYGEIQELVQWCSEYQPHSMDYPSIGNALVLVYNTAVKKSHPGKLDHQLLSDIEMLRLKFFGLDTLLVDWKRWHGVKELVGLPPYYFD